MSVNKWSSRTNVPIRRCTGPTTSKPEQQTQHTHKSNKSSNKANQLSKGALNKDAHTLAMGKCIAGPARETFKSFHGFAETPQRASPPNGHTTIESTGSPTYFAVSACPSSWAMIVTNNTGPFTTSTIRTA